MEEIETNIREYTERYPVTITLNENGNHVIEALNEGVYSGIKLDLNDIIDFYNEHQEVLKKK